MNRRGFNQTPSTTLPPLSVEAVLDDPVIYGEHTGLRYRLRYNSDGIRINQQRPVPSPDREDLTTILFLGDSFTQGYDDKNTLPQRTWEHLKAEIPPGFNLQILNAGLGSYSPAILIPQAKKLLPIYRPDLVVVVIDETDLPDDYFRYEQLIRRNSAGEVIAVRATPLDTEFLEGFRNIALHPLYLARVGHKLYHTAVFMPSFLAGYRSWFLPQILHFLGDRRGEIDEFFATETLVFRRNLMELGRVLVELVGDKTRVIFVRHPHLGHLRELNDPQRWKDLVARTVEGAAAQLEIRYYNAETDMRKTFGATPERYYWNGDMHFNFRGFDEYGRLVADRLVPMIAQFELAAI